ncbi:MAG: LysM peptidoglycan-binding domain-containing protein [Enterocloster clostridioformis]|uniref:LysM peptidoglycan-binding domain-containing protein n=1 Tax=Enterocloster clostridioformis TaxID=1531 RepID=UPI002432B275|nr:LysM peptidoglycan-binding domain-containing protein [Enterocloster clostridioformis]MCI6124660.1 LysM peptidoglycan-binding domain-containing protein [Enterocloster clostridioformis]MDY4764877.1 LysM peptidoglycan-binding domain-containing protein [Enterocloster clostridioformis]
MPYEVYIDDMLLPIPPQKIPIKYPGQNETATLINGEEINITRPPGLAEISIDVVLPQMDYPCAMWDGSVEDAEEFISRLQDLKESGDTFEFIVIRDSFDTNMDVTLEDYKVSDDVKEGLDLVVSITMKEARHYGTKIMNFAIVPEQPIPAAASPEPERPAAQPQVKTYTVKSGDCLWNIAKKQLGDGNRWKEIHNLNLDKISNPNLIHAGLVLVMP